MTDSDLLHLRSAIALSRRSRERGNQPFGALLIGPDGQLLLEAENTVVTGADCTGHAVTNLMRLASRQFTSDFLAGCSLYASTEPCPMCGGAIFWGGVGRVVFALSERAFYQLVGPDCDGLRVGCRDVFAHGQRLKCMDRRWRMRRWQSTGVSGDREAHGTADRAPQLSRSRAGRMSVSGCRLLDSTKASSPRDRLAKRWRTNQQ